MKKDYYEILGVPRNASQKDIKKAFWELAKKWHPDRVPPEKKKDAEEKFKEINEAYQVLSDPEKRNVYDMYGHAGVSQQGWTFDYDVSVGFDEFIDKIFRDFFQSNFFREDLRDFGFDFFGRRKATRRTPVGEDIKRELEITLEDAYSGTTKEIYLERADACSRCGGASKVDVEVCKKCGGRGLVGFTRGFFTFQQTCPECMGRGRRSVTCSACSGQGFFTKREKLNVQIPPGTRDRDVIKFSGMGNFGGDLYIVVRVKPHPDFKVKDDDIWTKVKVSTFDAILGGKADIKTPDGHATINIPAGTDSGTVLRLKGLGMPRRNGHGRGDIYVEVQISVPKKLSKEDRRIIEELAKRL